MDIYFRREIGNVLRSVASTDKAAENAHAPDNEQYHKGFSAALAAVGLAFGLHEMISQERKGPVWIEIEGEQ